MIALFPDYEKYKNAIEHLCEDDDLVYMIEDFFHSKMEHEEDEWKVVLSEDKMEEIYKEMFNENDVEFRKFISEMSHHIGHFKHRCRNFRSDVKNNKMNEEELKKKFLKWTMWNDVYVLKNDGTIARGSKFKTYTMY